MVDVPGDQPASRLPTVSINQLSPGDGSSFSEILSGVEKEIMERQEEATEDLIQELTDILSARAQHFYPRKRSKLEKKSVLDQLAVLGDINMAVPHLEDLSIVSPHDGDSREVSEANLEESTKSRLTSFLERVLVLPLATKSLFWRKIEESCSIWQGIADAESVHNQLHDVRSPCDCKINFTKFSICYWGYYD